MVHLIPAVPSLTTEFACIRIFSSCHRRGSFASLDQRSRPLDMFGDSGGYNPSENQSRSLHEDIQSPQQNQPQIPNKYDADPKTVPIDHEAVRQMSASESIIEGRQWIRNSNRKGTHPHEDNMQTRLLRHDAIFRRPHCLQYFHPNDSSSLIPPERLLSHPLSHESRNSSVSNGG